LLCPIKKKPAAQIAHLFFSNAKANAKKNKRAILANAQETMKIKEQNIICQKTKKGN